MSFEKQAGRSWIMIPGLIILALGIVFGLYFGLAYVLRKVNNETTGTTATTTKTSGKLADKNLVGTWESECLVPKLDEKWAEKHQIVIKSDGTATQTGWSWFMNDCTTLQPENTVVSQYNLAVPRNGKINFTYTGYNNPQMSQELQKTSKIAVGAIFYDIYQISNNSLKFGHGTRGDNESWGNKFGGSEAERIDSLNDFIVYKKK